MSKFSQFSGGGGIKSIQRGSIAIAVSSQSATATISAVVPSKTELRFLGSTSAEAGREARIELTNSTTITATAAQPATFGTTWVSWELTEWN